MDTVPCEHIEFEAHVEVNRLTENEESNEIKYIAEVRIRCVDCKEHFGFYVPDIGLLVDRPSVSPDFLELRVPLRIPIEKDEDGSSTHIS